jgi:hypothetical protein
MDNVRSSLNQLTEWCKKQRDFLKEQLDKLEAGQMKIFEARGDEAQTDVTAEAVQRVINQISELNQLKVGPGATSLTRMPNFAASAAAVRVSERAALLLAL